MALAMPVFISSTQGMVNYSNEKDDDRVGLIIPIDAGHTATQINKDLPFDEKSEESLEWSGQSSTRSIDVNDQLIKAWFTVSIELISSRYDDAWLHKSISKAEKYSMALYDVDEYRNFITSYLLILRNNSERLYGDQIQRKVLKRALEGYMASSHNTASRIQFLRVARAAGLSPAGA